MISVKNGTHNMKTTTKNDARASVRNHINNTALCQWLSTLYHGEDTHLFAWLIHLSEYLVVDENVVVVRPDEGIRSSVKKLG